MLSKRWMKNRLKEVILRGHKRALQAGVAVLPNHYYTAVPDLNALARNKPIWARRSQLRGMSIDLDAQAQRLIEICLPFEPEYRGNKSYRTAASAGCGPGFGYIEAQALHGVIRHYQPAKIVEVGAGVSTFCALDAIARNRDQNCRSGEITSIEPYPSPWLKAAPITLIPKPVQEAPASVFESLGAGDLLFIDSSHAVRTGSDVNFLILEVLPRLRGRVVVHFHDIYLPYDYPRDALDTIFSPQETALLHAFLIGNRGYRILFCLSHLHYDRTEVLRRVFPEYQPQAGIDGLRLHHGHPFDEAPGHFPSSIYLEVSD